MATMAASTAPKEKKTERAVTRYSFPRGICSRRSVPSVGSEPFGKSSCRKKGMDLRKGRTPTALPRKNKERQSTGNVEARELVMPKTDVKNKVALNAVLRPIRSEPRWKGSALVERI